MDVMCVYIALHLYLGEGGGHNLFFVSYIICPPSSEPYFLSWPVTELGCEIIGDESFKFLAFLYEVLNICDK